MSHYNISPKSTECDCYQCHVHYSNRCDCQRLVRACHKAVCNYYDDNNDEI